MDKLTSRCIDELLHLDRRRQGRLTSNDTVPDRNRVMVVLKKQHLLASPAESNQAADIQRRLYETLPQLSRRTHCLMPIQNLNGDWKVAVCVSGLEGYPLYEIESGNHATILETQDSLLARLVDPTVQQAVARLDERFSSSAAQDNNNARLLSHERVSIPPDRNHSAVCIARYGTAVTEEERASMREG